MCVLYVRPDMTGVLKTDAVMSKILKSGIAVDVLQVLNSLALLVQQYAN